MEFLHPERINIRYGKVLREHKRGDPRSIRRPEMAVASQQGREGGVGKALLTSRQPVVI